MFCHTTIWFVVFWLRSANNMLEALDRYKFGIVAVFVTYVIIFVYTNFTTFTYYPPVQPFLEQAVIENKEDVLEITPDDVIVPTDFDFTADVKNISQNVHDQREASYEEYSENRSPEQIAQDIRSLEAQMKQEAGGSAERAKLQRLIDERKEQQKLAAENAANNDSKLPASDKKYAGQTMVSWDLQGRTAHNNNDWYVRNPGYTCDGRSGIVVINVKVNSSGDVISAQYNAGASKGADNCMISKATKYAKMSRFAPSTKSNQQSGYIKYTFISK